VVVIALDKTGDASVGVVMDSIRAVLRVKRNEVEPVPELLRGRSGRGSGDNIAAICRLDQGRRLVSILSAETMFDRAEIDKLRHAGDRDMNDLSRSATVASVDAVDEEQFVVFRLMGEEYGVRIDAVQEIVRVPSELTRIPNCPDFIEGVINLRGAVLPVVDQRRRFRMESVERNDRQRIMVFTLNGVKTGFIVDFVSEVRRIPLSAIAAAPELSEEQRRIIRKVANLESEKRMILLLDVVQLLNAEEIKDMRSSMH
jgi:purine-binding chemotaxis protein CheW